MKNKNNLDLSGFFNQVPLGVGESLDFIKHHKEELEVEEYLIKCSLPDFLFVIVRLFKDKYPDIGGFGFYISEEISKTKNKNIKTYIKKAKYRNDITEIIYIYDTEDPDIPHHYHLISLEIKYNVFDFAVIKKSVEDALKGKDFVESSDGYTVKNSPIKKIIISPNRFFLEIDESTKVYY